MIYETKLLKALFFQKESFFRLAKAEVVYGFWKRIFWLLLAGAFVFFFLGWFGIGTSVLSGDLVHLPHSEYEGLKSFFLVGRFISGLLYAAFIIFLPALVFWTFSDAPYIKLALLQAITLPILLLEHVSYILLLLYFHIPWYSSPFSLGVIMQYVTDQRFIIFLFGSISIFKIWAISVQFTGLQTLTNRSKIWIVLMILFVHFSSWIFTALLGWIDFTKIL